MDFAKNLLEKYGWKEGQGIGKNANGISKPIKASLKFDSAGLGHDKAEEFTTTWWESAYNDAANNLNINKTDNDISVTLKNGDSIEITTRYGGLQSKNLKSDYAGSFIKSRCTLNTEESSEDEEIEFKLDETKPLTLPNILTDDDLFKACGGRTAHKGARHGLSLSGKLSRIEEQERTLLAKFSNNSFNKETAQEGFKDWIEVNSKKKKKKKKKLSKKLDDSLKVMASSVQQINNEDDLGSLINQDDYVIKYKSKKSKKKEKAIDEELAETLSNLKTQSPTKKKDTFHSISSTSRSIHKKSKKIIKKLKQKVLCDDRDERDPLTLSSETALGTSPVKRKRKSTVAMNGNDSLSEDSFSSETEERAIENTVLKQVKGQIEKREFEKIAKKMEKTLNIEEKDRKQKKKKSRKKRKILDEN